ncbi:hypothetical protein [Wolbachia endosymbiont of Ctenocephalides felis wCfeT]|uniref:hypothetical protein n=1 Tax=Wolbachia endosymbiont of Ctenocephalides felis wCfeT TaxID=2732593 RepID=UPI0014489A5D|nr:hypothetical protein [Wolbachia endosymbiont of Ctenocephalides felis wCfeT]
MSSTKSTPKLARNEKKHSWSTVFTWLYLNTIGRILPKKWNKWVEDILCYEEIVSNEEEIEAGSLEGGNELAANSEAQNEISNLKEQIRLLKEERDTLNSKNQKKISVLEEQIRLLKEERDALVKGLKESYRVLEDAIQEKERRLLLKVGEQSGKILELHGKVIMCKVEFAKKIEEKDRVIGSL